MNKNKVNLTLTSLISERMSVVLMPLNAFALMWALNPFYAPFTQVKKRVLRDLRPPKIALHLLAGNAAWDFKLKPLLVYHSKRPRTMKDFCKTTLPVIRQSNHKALTQGLDDQGHFSDLAWAWFLSSSEKLLWKTLLWKESAVTVGQCTWSPSQPRLLINWHQSWSCVSSSKHNFSPSADGSGHHHSIQCLLRAMPLYSANPWLMTKTAIQFEASGSLLTSWMSLKMSLRPGEKSQTTAWMMFGGRFGRSAARTSWDSNPSNPHCTIKSPRWPMKWDSMKSTQEMWRSCWTLMGRVWPLSIW